MQKLIVKLPPSLSLFCLLLFLSVIYSGPHEKTIDDTTTCTRYIFRRFLTNSLVSRSSETKRDEHSTRLPLSPVCPVISVYRGSSSAEKSEWLFVMSNLRLPCASNRSTNPCSLLKLVNAYKFRVASRGSCSINSRCVVQYCIVIV